MEVQNPHDKFFKKIFGDLAVAKDFLNNYLPEKIMGIIDIDTLEPQKDSHIDEELKESFSDLLFKANINNREGYLYLLFEHKSYPNRGCCFPAVKICGENLGYQNWRNWPVAGNYPAGSIPRQRGLEHKTYFRGNDFRV